MKEIIKINLSLIDSFKNHPFRVENDESLNELRMSIKENGLLNPLVVRRKDTFIEKCVNSRNKFSHVDENENYLFENENVVYIHKLILVFRLLVLEEIGLDKEINLSYLNMHLMLVNDYIKSVLSRK